MRKSECGSRNESELGMRKSECKGLHMRLFLFSAFPGPDLFSMDRLSSVQLLRRSIWTLFDLSRRALRGVGSTSRRPGRAEFMTPYTVCALSPMPYAPCALHQVSSIEYPASSIEHRASSIQHRASSIQHRVSSIEYPASSIQYPVARQQTPQMRQDSTWQPGVVSACWAR